MTPWLLLLIPFIGLLAWMRFEAGWLEVCRISVPEGTGLRIAVLSDLHPAYCCIAPERARAVLLAEKADLVLFLGDAADNAPQIARAADWLRTCAQGIPALAVPGNHDHKLFTEHPELLEVYRRALSDAGFRLCMDERFLHRAGRRPLLLTALDDYQQGGGPLPEGPGVPLAADRTDTSQDTPPFHLVFTHNPQRLADLPPGYADFAVAGHFHGGQIWMPFGLEFRLFRKEPLGRAGVRRGGHTINGTPVYLTRGIGNVLFPLRLGARPEITILEL